MTEPDYLTRLEAAEYARVSLTTWKQHAERPGILPVRFIGKLLHRRVDIR